MSDQHESHDGASESRDKWSHADKISLFTALIALLAALAALAPYVADGIHYLGRSRVTIDSPKNGTTEGDNAFGAEGTASSIPSDSDLWIVVRAEVEGLWYPAGRLVLVAGHWVVHAKLLCPATGPQEIEVYMIPDTSEAGLFAYVNGPDFGTSTGVNSLPPGAILEATSDVQVNGTSC
jgi:hypothetical protein